jgi:hypothetical protein
MKTRNILEGLENLIQSLSIDLRYEKGDFAGGLCRVANRSVLIVNDKLSPENKIKLIAAELRLLKLNHIYIRPALRKVIEEGHDW